MDWTVTVAILIWQQYDPRQLNGVRGGTKPRNRNAERSFNNSITGGHMKDLSMRIVNTNNQKLWVFSLDHPRDGLVPSYVYPLHDRPYPLFCMMVPDQIRGQRLPDLETICIYKNWK